MKIRVQIEIQSTKEKIWNVISDIEGSANTIKGIEKVEILEKPQDNLVGLKWRETRKMFGQTATEVMWITDAVENEYYTTRAESHGAIYTTELLLSSKGDSTELIMIFGAELVTFQAKLFSLMGFLFIGATKKALKEDLKDIKAKVESL
jgi:carbon monoxide dehydrogenase subunit G